MTRAPKPRKPTKKQIEKECLELWSLCVRTRDRVCRMCGSDKSLTSHHIRSRTHTATRYDTDNGLTVCWGQHRLQKLKPEWFQDKIIEIIGDEEYQRLKVKSLKVWKPSIQELIMMRDCLRFALKQLQSDYGTLEACRVAEEVGL